MKKNRVVFKPKSRSSRFYSARPFGGLRPPDTRISTATGMLNFMRGVFIKHNIVYDPKKDIAPNKIYLRPEVNAEISTVTLSYLIPHSDIQSQHFRQAMLNYTPSRVINLLQKEDALKIRQGSFKRSQVLKKLVDELQKSMRRGALVSASQLSAEEIIKLNIIDGFRSKLTEFTLLGDFIVDDSKEQ